MIFLGFSEYMKYAHGIVSEYLAEDLSKKLLQYLNLPDDAELKKRKLSSPKEATGDKRPKKEAQEESPRNSALDLTKPEKVRCVGLILRMMDLRGCLGAKISQER